MEQNRKYSMKYATLKTGLTPHTIRIWERRYQAVVPERSGTNRRLYSDDDIRKLQLLRQAIAAGHSIKQIAAMEIAELLDLAKRDKSSVHRNLSAQPVSQDVSPEDLIEEAMTAIYTMDSMKLEALLYKAAAAFSRSVLIEKFLARYLETIGEQWHDGSLRIAQEHFSAPIIQRFIMDLCRRSNSAESAPILLCTTPAGQNHEFGALMVAATAIDCGWKSLYLGSNLPAEEIAGAAASNQVQAVALSIVYPANDPGLSEELQILRRCLPPEVSIMAGGRSVASYKEALDSIQAVVLSDYSTLRTYLASFMSPVSA